jgi:hypothetical protein
MFSKSYAIRIARVVRNYALRKTFQLKETQVDATLDGC